MPDPQTVKFTLDLTWPMLVFGIITSGVPFMVLCWKIRGWIADLIVEIHAATNETKSNGRRIDELTIRIDGKFAEGSRRMAAHDVSIGELRVKLGMHE